jgi:hypothetical protein
MRQAIFLAYYFFQEEYSRRGWGIMRKINLKFFSKMINSMNNLKPVRKVTK